MPWSHGGCLEVCVTACEVCKVSIQRKIVIIITVVHAGLTLKVFTSLHSPIIVAILLEYLYSETQLIHIQCTTTFASYTNVKYNLIQTTKDVLSSQSNGQN